MENMSGGQAIVKTLVRHGIDTVFGLPGIQLDHTFDALYEARNQVKTLHTRHEQGAAYMATGYAAATGKVGTFLVVPGPGILNTGAAMSTAAALNAPVLGLTGQIPSYQIGVGLGMTHEIRDQLMAVRGVVDWAERADTPADAPLVLREAFRQMLSGRNKPVVFEMAPDQMGRKMDVSLLDPVKKYDQPEIDDDALLAAAKMLGKAKKPMIFVGGGVFGAEKELKQIAEMLEAPVVMSRTGRGALSDKHHLAQTMVSGQELWSDVDAALVVGTKWLHPAMAWGRTDQVKTVRIEVDPHQAKLPAPHDVTIVAHAKAALGKLAKVLGKHNIKRKSRKTELTKAKKEAWDTLSKMTQQRDFGLAIRDTLPEDGIIVSDVTQMGTFCQYALPYYNPRTLIMTGYQGTLGAGYAMALGAQVGQSNKKVVCVSGDGGFMFNVQEMSTAVKHKIPLVCIVFADAHFGNVKRIQNDSYGGRNIGVELENPDFVKLAEAFGMLGLRATNGAELKKALKEAFDAKGPVLIEVPVGDLPSIWDYIRRPPSAGVVKS